MSNDQGVPAEGMTPQDTPAGSAPAEDLSLLATERRDERFADLDTRSTLGVLEAMNDAEAQVPRAVASALPALAALVDATAQRIEAGGRLIYVGCLLYTSPSPRD